MAQDNRDKDRYESFVFSRQYSNCLSDRSVKKLRNKMDAGLMYELTDSNLIPKSQGDYILQVHTRQKNRIQPKTIWRDAKNLSSTEISRHYFRLPTQFQKAL